MRKNSVCLYSTTLYSMKYFRFLYSLEYGGCFFFLAVCTATLLFAFCECHALHFRGLLYKSNESSSLSLNSLFLLNQPGLIHGKDMKNAIFCLFVGSRQGSRFYVVWHHSTAPKCILVHLFVYVESLLWRKPPSPPPTRAIHKTEIIYTLIKWQSNQEKWEYREKHFQRHAPRRRSQSLKGGG